MSWRHRNLLTQLVRGGRSLQNFRFLSPGEDFNLNKNHHGSVVDFFVSPFVSAGIVLTRVGYYTIPSMEELGKMLNENGECIVENFTVGRKGTLRITGLKTFTCVVKLSNREPFPGYGSVFFPGEVNLTNLNLDEIVHLRRKEIIVYPDDKDKPSAGEGLNRLAAHLLYS